MPPDLEDTLRSALAPTYQLVRALGTGGMGSVFLAREPALKRSVAVKVLAPDLAANPAARARFEREAQAVAALSHPNVVAVHAVGELPDGTPYFVMQHVAGRSMAERVTAEGPLPVNEARRVLGEVAAALAAAHARGIIHRDIKPANILYDDEAGRALVSDFGIAAVTAKEGATESTRLTQTGMVVGTPQYMSPEQLLSEPVTAKTDVYALGLLGYELLAGAGPFQATTPQELIAAHLRDTPRRLAEVRDEVDAELDALVSRCLDKHPDQRPTAAEVARRLAPGGGTLLEWPPPGLESLAGGLARTTRWYWVGTALMLAAALPLLLAGSRLEPAGQALGATLLLLAGVAGLAALVRAARITLQLGTSATRAVRGGFAWLTVLETLADSRGDTGSLIAGARDFAGLSAELRSRLRTARAGRAVTLALGGTLPLPLLLVVLLLGSQGTAFPALAWVALLPPFAALVIEARLRQYERRVASPPRKKKRVGPGPDLPRLSGAWYEGFESVRQGQPLGRGPLGRPGAGRTAAWAAVVLAVLAGVILAPLIAVGAVGPVYWQIVMPNFANTQQKADIAEAVRPFGAATDSSITPLEAGRAFAALQGQPPEGPFPMYPQPTFRPAVWNGALPEGLFPTARPRVAPGLPHHLTILEAAVRGFTPAEMAYLEQVAHDQLWPYFSTVARAGAVDYIGGRFRVPFPDTVEIFAMPIPKFARTKAVAYAAASRAAWFLARGERDSAETTLREVIAFGFAMVDDGTTLIDALIGAVIIAIGRDNLQQFYAITRNPLGARLQALRDSAQSLADERAAGRESPAGGGSAGSAALRAQALGIATNPRYMRGLRVEMLRSLGLAPCTNLRELIFGPGDDIASAFAGARQDLARYPSEQSLLDMISTGPERLRYAGLDDNLARRGIGHAADLLGAALANPRIPGCARLVLYLSTM